jgi:hypothetical protein
MPSHGKRRFLKGLGATVAAMAVFTAWIATGTGGETTVLWVSGVGIVVAALAGAVMCARAARRDPRLRRFWQLLGAACTAWMLGEATWSFYDLALKEPVPLPSWADAGYLVGTALAAAALLSHPALRDSDSRRLRSVLDGLVVGTALLFLSWTLVLGPLELVTDENTVGGIVSLAYPFGDAVILWFVLLVIKRMPRGDRLALGCLLAGLLSILVSDSAYAYVAGVQGYSTGNLLDAGWFLGYIGIALGGWSARATAPALAPEARARPAFAPVVVAFAPMLAALTLIGVRAQLGTRPDRIAALAAIALVVLVLLRQSLLVVDLMKSGRVTGVSVAARLQLALLGTVPKDAR